LAPVSSIKEIESIQFKEEAMRIKMIVALFAVMLAGTAFAGDNGCKLQGTWIGETPYPLPDDTPMDPTDDIYYMLKFFTVYHGTGDTEGTDVIEWINPVPGPSIGWSNVRGIWKKIGPNKYSYTAIGYMFNVATGDIVQIVRHGGTKLLTDCNTMEVTSGIEYLAPDMTPLMCISGTSTLHRIPMQEPCEPD